MADESKNHLPVHHDLRKVVDWEMLIKVIGVLMTIGGIVFGAGLMVGEFRTFKAEVKGSLQVFDAKVNQANDSASKANSTSTDAAMQLRELRDEFRRAQGGHGRRRRPVVTDNP